jgi:hypothetical protein
VELANGTVMAAVKNLRSSPVPFLSSANSGRLDEEKWVEFRLMDQEGMGEQALVKLRLRRPATVEWLEGSATAPAALSCVWGERGAAASSAPSSATPATAAGPSGELLVENPTGVDFLLELRVTGESQPRKITAPAGEDKRFRLPAGHVAWACPDSCEEGKSGTFELRAGGTVSLFCGMGARVAPHCELVPEAKATAKKPAKKPAKGKR